MPFQQSSGIPIRIAPERGYRVETYAHLPLLTLQPRLDATFNEYHWFAAIALASTITAIFVIKLIQTSQRANSK